MNARALLLLLPLVAMVARAQEQDDVLTALVSEALDARPELAQARAGVKAARERIPQAQAWPDPMLQVGVQNDGFTKWQIGSMGTSWVSFMATQTIPFPGKSALRGDVAASDAKLREVAVERVRLSTIAEVRRAYLGLQWARDRQALLAQLRELWATTSGVAQSRYETAEGSQADLLRARLEQTRLTQRARLLELQELLQLQALNRLRAKPLDTPVQTGRRLTELPFPAAMEDVVDSPELQAAHDGVERAGRARTLSERLALPDLTVGAGVMVRGPLEPMWAVTLGLPVPIFAGSKQGRGVAEANASSEGAAAGVVAVTQSLQLRTSQRQESLRALGEVWRAYQGGLLRQAQEAADSALVQYRVGKGSFVAVLEANASFIQDSESSLQVLAEAWQLVIAQDERALSEPQVAPLSTSAPSGAPSSQGM